MKEHSNKVWKIIFYVYLFLLFMLVVLKFYGDISAVIDRQALIMADKKDGLDNINLVPFATIKPYLRLFTRSFAYRNILANLFFFIPFGYLLPLAYPKCNTYLKTMGVCLAGIIFIEVFQYVSCFGFCDIDDVILNSIGSTFGYLMCRINGRFLASGVFTQQ